VKATPGLTGATELLLCTHLWSARTGLKIRIGAGRRPPRQYRSGVFRKLVNCVWA
jgi:hypothetical protein